MCKYKIKTSKIKNKKIEEEIWTHRNTRKVQHGPYEDTMRRWPSARQGQRPQKKPNSLTLDLGL